MARPTVGHRVSKIFRPSGKAERFYGKITEILRPEDDDEDHGKRE